MRREREAQIAAEKEQKQQEKERAAAANRQQRTEEQAQLREQVRGLRQAIVRATRLANEVTAARRSYSPRGAVVKEHSNAWGQRIREYASGDDVVIFPTGQKQTNYEDGTKETIYPPPNAQKQTKYTDGTLVTEFTSGSQWAGQKKTEHPDGVVVIGKAYA